MQGKTHAVAGIAVGLAVSSPAGPWALALGAFAGAAGGLIPDWIQINIPGASKQLRGTFGHRGFSHWIWLPLALVIWPGPRPDLALALAAGWLSHIALDALSNGVPAFWPFGRITLAHIKTGSKLDTLTGAALLLMAGLTIITQLMG